MITTIKKYPEQQQEIIKSWFATQCDDKSRLKILRKKGIMITEKDYRAIKYQIFLQNKKLGLYNNGEAEWK